MPPQASGTRQQGHGIYKCHACGWPYSNHHPSAKQRRSHKKHCGKLEGYGSMAGRGEVSNGGVSAVTSRVEELVPSEGTAVEVVSCMGDLGASEGIIVEGKSLEHADGPSSCSGVDMYASHMTSASKIDSSSTEVVSNADPHLWNTDEILPSLPHSILPNCLDEIKPSLPHISPVNSSEKLDIDHIQNVPPISPINSSEKTDKTIIELDNVTSSSGSMDTFGKSAETSSKLDYLVQNVKETDKFLDYNKHACKVEWNTEKHLASKDEAKLVQQAHGTESCGFTYYQEFGPPELNDISSVIQTGFTSDASDENWYANIDEKNHGSSCLIDETDTSSSFRSVLFNKSKGSDYPKDMTQKPLNTPNMSLVSTEIERTVSNQKIYLSTSMEHTSCETEVVKLDSMLKESEKSASLGMMDPVWPEADTIVCGINCDPMEGAIEGIKLSEQNDTGKESRTSFAFQCPNLTYNDSLERNLKDPMSVENFCTLESQCFETKNGHVPISSERPDEQGNCIESTKVGNILIQRAFMEQEEFSNGSSLQDGKCSEKGSPLQKSDCTVKSNGVYSASPSFVGDVLTTDVLNVQFNQYNLIEKNNFFSNSCDLKETLFNNKETTSINSDPLTVQIDPLIACPDALGDYSVDQNRMSGDLVASLSVQSINCIGVVPLERVPNGYLTDGAGAESSVPKELSTSPSFEGNDLSLDVQIIDEISKESSERNDIKFTKAVELLNQLEENLQSNEMIRNQGPVNPTSPGEEENIDITLIDYYSCDFRRTDFEEHYHKSKLCSSQSDTKIHLEGTSVILEKHETLQKEASKLCSILQLTETTPDSEMDSKGINTSTALRTGDCRASLTTEVVTKQADTHALNKKQISLTSLPGEDSEKALSIPHPDHLKIDAKTDKLGTIENLPFELDSSGGCTLSLSQTEPAHLDDGGSVIVQGETCVAVHSASCASNGSIQDHSTKPGHVSWVDMLPFHTPQPKEDQITTDTASTLSGVSSVSNENGFEHPLPKIKSKPEMDTISSKIQTELKLVQTELGQMGKEVGEIREILASESMKIRTPLKSLLEESTEIHISEPNGQLQMQEQNSPRTLSTALPHEQPPGKRVVQKEWNSPARLPQSSKNTKGKSKGKPQWVPFMCCTSLD